MSNARLVHRKFLVAVALLLTSGCGESHPAGPEPTGSIHLTTITTGSPLDPDGYTLTMDGVEVQPIGINSTVTLAGLALGLHQVGLTDVAWDCEATSLNPQQVTVAADEMVSTSFDVRCAVREIAFVRRFSTGGNAIYAMAADGFSPVRLIGPGVGEARAAGEDAWLSQPAWSPDGEEIAFSMGDIFGWTPSNVWRMDAGGSDLVNLTDGAGGADDPAWSPDGTRIAFTTGRDGNDEVYVMEADGSDPMNLTNLRGAADRDPAWSPDGTKIAFSRAREGDFEIYVMDADGSNPINLTNHPSARDRHPAWSPDGTRIAFWTDRDGNFEVYVMDADGSNPMNLTNHPARDGYFDRPAWSPDGKRIAFTTDRDGDFEIYVMDADGSEPVNLTNHPADDDSPAWLPRR